MLRDEDLVKPLSAVYTVNTSSPRIPNCPALVGGAAPLTRLISARDQLTHYKCLHHIYLTPAMLAKIFDNSSSSCWGCSVPGADFMHFF